MVDFVACGNLTIDDVVSADDSVAPNQCGGSGLYAALGMWLWGEDVGLVAGAGTDYPDDWLNQLADAGLNLDGVYSVSEGHALRSRVFYRPDGTRTDRLAEVELTESARASFDTSSDFSAMGSEEHNRAWPMYSPTAARIPEPWRTASGFHLAPGPSGHLLDIAKELGILSSYALITLDWPWWNKEETGLDLELIRSVSAVLPGAEELERWPVAGSPEATLSALVAACPLVVVKRGSLGADVHVGGTITSVGTVDTDAIDPTGAGDSYCGGFLVGLARTGDPVIAAIYGAVSASIVVESFGALSVLATDTREPRKRLEQLSRKSGIEGAVA